MDQQGFTLLEILIAMMIIGILSAIALPQYEHYILQSKVTSAYTSLQAMRPNIEQLIAFEGRLKKTLKIQDIGMQQLDTKSIGILSVAHINQAQSDYVFQVEFKVDALKDKVLQIRRFQGVWSCITDLPSLLAPSHCKMKSS